MTIEARKTPYFSGQEPDKCGHYYPDVVRVSDRKTRCNHVYRMSHCVECGYSEERIARSAYCRDSANSMKWIDKIRAKERKRLLSKRRK